MDTKTMAINTIERHIQAIYGITDPADQLQLRKDLEALDETGLLERSKAIESYYSIEEQRMNGAYRFMQNLETKIAEEKERADIAQENPHFPV